MPQQDGILLLLAMVVTTGSLCAVNDPNPWRPIHLKFDIEKDEHVLQSVQVVQD